MFPLKWPLTANGYSVVSFSFLSTSLLSSQNENQKKNTHTTTSLFATDKGRSSRFLSCMSVTESFEKDIPLSTVFEATGTQVTVETLDGSLYKGRLVTFDTKRGNIELVDVRSQARDSSLSISERIYVRGCNIRLIHMLPEMKMAPTLNWRKDSVFVELRKSLKRPRKARPPKIVVKDTSHKKDKSKRLKKLR